MIRFRKLEMFAKEIILEYEIHIFYSTELQEDIVGFVKKDNKNVNILVNVSLVKTEKECLCVICHELSHVLSGSKEHDKRKIKRILRKGAEYFNITYSVLDGVYRHIEKKEIIRNGKE